MPKAKKQSNKSKLLNWLKPGSPRKNILLFMLAFAIVGGGYMAYKSFAASNPPLVYTQQTITSESAATNILRVNVDGSGIASIQSAVTTFASGSGTYITDGKYSPDHNFVAWTGGTDPNTTFTDTVYISDTTGYTSGNSKAGSLKAFSLPVGEMAATSPTTDPIAWYPDSRQIAVLTQDQANPANYKLRLLNISTGAFTLITTLGAGPTSGANLNSLAVLGDDKSIAYTDSTGVKVIKAGSTTPVQRKTATDCGKIEAQPGTQTGFVYTCAVSNSTSKLFSQSSTGSATTIYSTVNVSGQSTHIIDFAVSPDNTQVAVYTISSNKGATKCSLYTWGDIQTVSYTGTVFGSIQTGTRTDATGGCGGKGGPGPVDNLVWSPDGQYMAYLDGITAQQNSTLYVVPTSLFASVYASTYTGPTKIADNVYDISW